VVFADADLDLAARDAVAFSLFNAGQVCCAIERVYIDVAVKEEFERRVVEEARKWTVGPGNSKDSKVGIFETQFSSCTVALFVRVFA
jgi:acyl-CoA reductase-like NAD-dependent aldehyde dehydrogenase